MVESVINSDDMATADTLDSVASYITADQKGLKRNDETKMLALLRKIDDRIGGEPKARKQTGFSIPNLKRYCNCQSVIPTRNLKMILQLVVPPSITKMHKTNKDAYSALSNFFVENNCDSMRHAVKRENAYLIESKHAESLYHKVKAVFEKYESKYETYSNVNIFVYELLWEIFDLLQAFDGESQHMESIVLKQSVMDLVDDFYDIYVPDTLIDSSGTMPDELERILSASKKAIYDDLIFVSKYITIDENVLSAPNMKSLMLFRFYSSLYHMVDNEFAKKIVFDLYRKCRTNWEVCLNPNIVIKSPSYIGEKVILTRNVTIEQFCVIADNVIVHPCRTHPTGIYKISIGKNSFIGKNACLMGDFSLDGRIVIDSNTVFTEANRLEAFSVDQVQKNIQRYFSERKGGDHA